MSVCMCAFVIVYMWAGKLMRVGVGWKVGGGGGGGGQCMCLVVLCSSGGGGVSVHWCVSSSVNI